MSKLIAFNNDWINKAIYPDWCDWLKSVASSKYQAYCSACRHVIELSNMGKRAIMKHGKGIKHIKNVNGFRNTMNIKEAFGDKSDPAPSVSIERTVPSKNSANLQLESLKENPLVKTYIAIDAVHRAEILWCLHSVKSHLSLRTAASGSDIMKVMFPSCPDIQKMTLGKDKIAYTITYGLAPVFQNELLKIISDCHHIVIYFDESLNKVAQLQQMDILVRYFDETSKLVVTRYFNSSFLGHTCASDMLEAFTKGLNGFDLSKIIQISMDGPNVNWKFLSFFKGHVKSLDPDHPVLIEIGSCGLHIIHGAFKTGEKSTSWNIIKFLRDIYNLLKNVPARRSDYMKYSGSRLFPLKFCSVRWIENSDVAKRALQILPFINIYAERVIADNKAPKCESFNNVVKEIKKDLLPAKLAFFLTIANEVQPFLTEFQSDKPLAPFLYDALCNVIRSIMSRFIKKEVIVQANSRDQLSKIDLTKQANMLKAEEIDIGFETKAALRKCNKKISDNLILQFRRDCILFMSSMVKKIFERCPLKYKMTKGISCLNPNVVMSKSVGPLNIALAYLTENNWVSGMEADRIKKCYTKLGENQEIQLKLKMFSRTKDRLDVFWLDLITRYELEELSQLVKMILILSHGNAAVERSFSVNKECILENLTEDSLIAQRVVYDRISIAGGVHCIDIDKKLIHSALNANARWKETLHKKRIAKANDLKEKIEKRKIENEIKELQLKKKKLLDNVSNEICVLDNQMLALQHK